MRARPERDRPISSGASARRSSAWPLRCYCADNWGLREPFRVLGSTRPNSVQVGTTWAEFAQRWGESGQIQPRMDQLSRNCPSWPKPAKNRLAQVEPTSVEIRRGCSNPGRGWSNSCHIRSMLTRFARFPAYVGRFRAKFHRSQAEFDRSWAKLGRIRAKSNRHWLFNALIMPRAFGRRTRHRKHPRKPFLASQDGRLLVLKQCHSDLFA